MYYIHSPVPLYENNTTKPNQERKHQSTTVPILRRAIGQVKIAVGASGDLSSLTSYNIRDQNFKPEMIKGKQQLTSCTEDGEGEGARLLYVLAGRTSREAREFS